MASAPGKPLLTTDVTGLEQISRGKVRDIFRVGDDLLLVATDRISAFDVVMAEGVPGKGRVLTHVSEFWFRRLAGLVPNHLITTDVNEMPAEVRRHADQLAGRSMLVRRARPFAVEFVVRGYLAGSGLAEYRKTGSICGVSLPEGLVESSRLPEPILTPTTKAEAGHDEPIDFGQVENLLGSEMAAQARDVALLIFNKAHELAETRGLLLADTKFEFGLLAGELLWIDEALTPDSSRYWSRMTYRAGEPQQPFDKQVMRNYLLKTGWNRKPPPPALSREIVEETSARYIESARILTGRSPFDNEEKENTA
ncbi:MAG: phosphoribosylaminoimidazolesuccinocarboxamide synthase [Planctomycetota bacterium]